MAENTPISWAKHTLNLWWGCDEPGAEPGTDFTQGTDRAPECLNCYARTWDHRMGGDHWGPGPRKFASESYLAKALKWNAEAQRRGERHGVFVQSMGDWAELHPDPVINARMDEYRGKLWGLIRATPWLDWLLLTKRVDRLMELLPWTCTQMLDDPPWPNAWLGTTCGSSRTLWRAERLRQLPAVRRFISAEPLVDHISAEQWDRVLAPAASESKLVGRFELEGTQLARFKPSFHWLIVGDESEHEKRRRPAQPDWIRTAREAALRNGVVFHFKQWNGPSSHAIHGMRAEHRSGAKGKIHLPVLDGRVWDGRPTSVVDPNS